MLINEVITMYFKRIEDLRQDHDLTQQTCYYLNNMENPFPKDITVLWNSIPPSTTLPSQDLKDLKENKLPNDQKETDTSVESKKSFSL